MQPSLFLRGTLVLTLSLFCACATSHSDGVLPGPTAGAADAGVPDAAAVLPDGAHPLCDGTDVGGGLPAGFGAVCEGVDGPDTCALANRQCVAMGATCVYDGSLVGLVSSSSSLGTCSVPCDPEDASSCPVDYACVRSKCGDKGFVCAADPKAKPACTSTKNLGGGTSGFFFDGLVVMADGTTYLHGYVEPSQIVLMRPPGGGAFNTIFRGTRLLEDVEAGRAGRYAVFGSAGSSFVVVVDGGTAAEEPLPRCDDGDQTCPTNIERVFAAGDEARILATSSSGKRGFILARDAARTWRVVGTLDTRVNSGGVAKLERSGLVARCAPSDSAVCVSEDGVSWRTIDLPAGEQLSGPAAAAVAGESTSDFYLGTNAGNIYHRVGDRWAREPLPAGIGQAVTSGAPPRGAVPSLIRGADGAVYTTYFSPGDVTQAFALVDGCWRRQGLWRNTVLTGTPYQGAQFLSVNPSDQVLCATAAH